MSTNFKHGLASYGIPLLGSGGNIIPTTTGSYFFVSSVTGSNGNAGTTKDSPLATIDAAINKCTADKGDVIIVMPNHAETIADAAGLVPDVSGITIVGLGNATNQPEITYSATGSKIIVTGANTILRNIRFIAGISAVVIGLDIDANNVTVDGCTFTFGATAYDFLVMIDIDAYDDCVIQNCKFGAENAVAGASAGVQLDDANNVVIKDSFFSGDFSLAAIANPTADALGKNLLIANNIIYNDDTASSVNGIALQNACTGVIVGNLIGTLYATNPDATIDPGSCLSIENYICNAVNESGTIVPTAIST